MLADVGTDHGYIPIYLLQQKKIRKAIAMDVAEGPLLRAKEHIAQLGLGGYIETRISDGVLSLGMGEADSILIAGMGGGLILKILWEGKPVIESGKELILQPQSEIGRVREYLYRHGYKITGENMVREDGKYYQMFSCVPKEGADREFMHRQDPLYCRYGRLLLSQRHPVLKDYLLYMGKQYKTILENLKKQQETTAICERRKQIERELGLVEQALEYWR